MSIGLPDINKYFKIAMSYPVERLQAVIRNQDNSIPAVAAMAAFDLKYPMVVAAKAQQTAQQQTPFSVRQNLAQKGEETQTAGMLPENTGIGQLPAENMETMHAADGGIIGYADGGYVPGYAGEYGSDINEEEIAVLTDEQIAALRGRGSPPLSAVPEKTRKFLENKDKPKEGKGKVKGRAGVPVNDTNILDELFGKPTPSPNRPNGRVPEAPEAPAYSQAEVDKLRQADKTMRNMPSAVIPMPEPDLLKKKTKATTDTAPGIAALPSQAPKVEPTTVDPLSKIGADINRTFGVDKLKEGADSIARSYATTDEEARERFKLRPTYTPYEKYERSLLSEEQNAAKDKKDAFYDALVNAGLGIAAGKSQYGLQNIAEGAMVGTKQYSAAMKDLKAAGKERQKAFAMIDEARLAKTEKDFDRADALEDKIAGHQIEAKKLGIDALAKTLQITVPEATKMYDAQVAQAGADRRSNAEIAGRLQNTREQIAGHLAGQRIMAGAYGANKDQYNVLADNARARADKWAESSAGQIALLKDPTLRDRKYREYLQEEYAAKGISLPNSLTGGGTMPGLSADDQSLIQRNLK